MLGTLTDLNKPQQNYTRLMTFRMEQIRNDRLTKAFWFSIWTPNT